MRLSTANTFDNTISTLQSRQLQLQKSQIQLASGKRISQASDDPTGAAQAERSRAEISRIDADNRALQASQNAMTLAESALGDGMDILQQIRETVVQAGDGSYTDSERKALANKIQDLRNQLLTATAAQANAASEHMTVPVALLGVAFMALIAYPAFARIFAG